MRACRGLSTGASCALAALFACGAEPPPEPAPQPAATEGQERAPERPRMEVTGLMGTIPERKIQGTLEPKLPSFARCFAQGAAEVETIAGRMEFYFRVALDGSVEWVYPRASTVGHRATELCLLDVAKRVRFPEPKGGGPAELAWSFEIEPGDVRPPVEWEADQVSAAREGAAEAMQACGVPPASLAVTAYVASGGSVLGAGASARDREATEGIDCVLDQVRGWALPDPGSYPAKVTFDAP